MDFYFSIFEKLSMCIRVLNFKSIALRVLEICLRECQILQRSRDIIIWCLVGSVLNIKFGTLWRQQQLALTIIHVTWTLASPPATVGTAFQLGILTVGVSSAEFGADSCVSGRQRLRWTCAWPDDVDLVEKVTTFTARRYLRRLLLATATFSSIS